jgi:hypothetical protein
LPFLGTPTPRIVVDQYKTHGSVVYIFDALWATVAYAALHDAPHNLGTILTGVGILALLMPFIGGAIGGALGARTGRRRP